MSRSNPLSMLSRKCSPSRPNLQTHMIEMHHILTRVQELIEDQKGRLDLDSRADREYLAEQILDLNIVSHGEGYRCSIRDVLEGEGGISA